MPLLDQEARDQIGELFEKLEEQVRLVFFTQQASKLILPGRPAGRECPSCEDEQQLLGELVELSDKLELEVHDVKAEPELAGASGIDKVPALVLRGPKEAGAVRFFGLPGGYEFATLIADIVDVSTSNIQLSDKTRKELDALTEPVHIQVFVTPT
jgi:alkyl hydroperoxide reductase subunit AhpF